MSDERYTIHNFAGDEGSIDSTVVLHGDSSWFNGHFPGMPVLPGVAQLVIINELLNRHFGREISFTRINRTKFKKIVEPEEILNIHIDIKENNYTYTIAVGDETVSSGSMAS